MSDQTTPSIDVHTLALHKMTEVLGPTHAQQLLDMFLQERNCNRLDTPVELAALAARLEREDQPVRTIGANLRRYAKLLSS